MLNEESVFVGVGQCGGNLGWSLEQKGCFSFYVNSATEDLDYIPAIDSHKYHIQGARGTAKNKETAKEITLQEGVTDSICNKVHSEFANCRIVTYGFSTGGGTGGTSALYIAETMYDMYPEKTIDVVAVLPGENEDLTIQINSLQCLKHIKRLYDENVINNVQFLDNNKGNYKKINENFAMSYSKFLSFDNSDAEGNLDEEEQLDVLTARGSMVIYDFANDDFLAGLLDASNDTIYFKAPKLPSTIGMVINKRFVYDDALEATREVVGFAPTTHKSEWNEDSNIVISSGIDFESQYLLAENHIKNQISKIKQAMKEAEENAKKEMGELDNVDIDIDSIMKDIPTKGKRTPRQREGVARTGRRRSTVNLREKYRNL